MITLLTLFLLQGRSLFGRLILVPTRVGLMLIVRAECEVFGLYIFIFLLIFVGGLLVLLARVSSVLVQEQRALLANINWWWLIGVRLVARGVLSLNNVVDTIASLTGWVRDPLGLAILLCYFLVVALLVISGLLLFIKTPIRGICFYSVSAQLRFEEWVRK